MSPLPQRRALQKASGIAALSRLCRVAIPGRAPSRKLGQFAAASLTILIAATASSADVLNQSDLQNVQALKPMFLNLMGDLVQTSRRTDISSADAECVRSTIQELVQISQELLSYEYLITLGNDLNDDGNNAPLREIMKFAIDKSNGILSGGRKRLTELSNQCSRLPLSHGKTQQALQVLDATTGVLSSIRPRL